MVAIAVLGCGRIGRMHARNLARHPRAKLISVFDTVPASASEAGAELGVTAAHSVEAVLGDPKVRAVLIATPTDTHVPLITAAVKAGKAVLCEKPVDLDLARAQACWNDIKGLKPVVMLGFNRRFDPSFRAVRERLQTGEIGKLEQVCITSRDPGPPPVAYIKVSGGLFKDMTIHDLDMARYLAGDIAEVHAFGGNLVDQAIAEVGDIDACSITLKARSGALIQISNSRRCAYGYDQRVEVFGSEGMLMAGNQRATAVEKWDRNSTTSRDVVLNFFIERYRQAYDAEVDAFVTAVEGGTAVSPGFEDGVAALALADACEQSMKTGRVVKM